MRRHWTDSEMAIMLETVDSRFAIVAVAYGCVIFAHGHSALPLGLVVPWSWLVWADADLVVRVVGGLGAIGLVGFMLAFFIDSARWSSALFRCGAVLAWTVSMAVAVVGSEVWLVTAISSLPFAAALAWFVAAGRPASARVV